MNGAVIRKLVTLRLHRHWTCGDAQLARSGRRSSISAIVLYRISIGVVHVTFGHMCHLRGGSRCHGHLVAGARNGVFVATADFSARQGHIVSAITEFHHIAVVRMLIAVIRP